MPSEKFAEVSRGFRRRLGCVLAVREGLRFTFAWNMFWAGAVVALRAVWLVDRSAPDLGRGRSGRGRGGRGDHRPPQTPVPRRDPRGP